MLNYCAAEIISFSIAVQLVTVKHTVWLMQDVIDRLVHYIPIILLAAARDSVKESKHTAVDGIGLFVGYLNAELL